MASENLGVPRGQSNDTCAGSIEDGKSGRGRNSPSNILDYYYDSHPSCEKSTKVPKPYLQRRPESIGLDYPDLISWP